MVKESMRILIHRKLWMKALLSSKLPAGLKVVGIVAAQNLGTNPGQDYYRQVCEPAWIIAAESGREERTVQNDLSQLRKLGWLISRGREYDGRGAHIYELQIPEGYATNERGEP